MFAIKSVGVAKRLLAAMMVFSSIVGIPALTASPAGACSFDYVVSAKVISKSYSLGTVYLSNALQGPGTVGATWGYSKTNSVSGSLELNAEAASIGVSAQTSITYSQSQSASFPVPAGKYGKVALRVPTWTFQNDLVWSVCGTTQAPTRVTRTYRTSAMYTQLQTRTTPW